MILGIHKHRHGQGGYSYVEVLVATVLIAICLVPAMDALRTASSGSEIFASYSEQHYRLLAKMEEMLALAHGALDSGATQAASPTTATDYSDPVGTNDRRLVYLAHYDIDNADADNEPFLTGSEPTVVWVRVEIEGTAMSVESLAAW